MKNFFINFKFSSVHSLVIAIALHFFLLILFVFLNRPRSEVWNDGFDQKNTIAVNFGLKGNGRPGAKTQNQSQKSTSVSAAEDAQSLSNSASSSSSSSPSSSSPSYGSGAEGSVGGNESEGIGNGSGFEGAVSSYRDPSYPRAAIKRNLQGTMKIKISLTGAGTLKNVDVLTSTGHPILDRAALDAIATWTFKPHPKNLTYFVYKTIIFELK